MTDTFTATPEGQVQPEASLQTARVVRRRRSLPGGRAVVGAFLVTLAAVGIFAAYTRATDEPQTLYIVARHNLNLGDRLAAGDLALAPMHLPTPLSARRAFTRASAPSLVGAVVVAPVASGELIQASSVVEAVGTAVDREISFAIDPARAVAGRLVPGEVVDLLATYGTGTDATTVVVVRAARLVSRSDSSGSLGARASEVVILALPSSADALAVAHAVDSGQITLVRATGAPPSDDQGSLRTRSAADAGSTSSPAPSPASAAGGP